MSFYWLTFICNGQTNNSEWEFVKSSTDKRYAFYDEHHNNSASFMQTKHSGIFKNILRAPLSIAMFTYQNVVSPQLSTGCQYQLTCSNFAKESIAEFGVFKGVLVAMDRLYRCNIVTVRSDFSYKRDEQGKIIDNVCDYSSKY